MTVEQFLGYLNLPIFGGVLYVAYKAGWIANEIKDHARRIGELERRSWPRAVSFSGTERRGDS